MKNLTIKNLLLGLLVATLSACGGDDNYMPYYPGSGLACVGLDNANLLGVYRGNFGDGASFAVDLYEGAGGKIAAVGDMYVPDLNRLWNSGQWTPIGGTNTFASCLTSNGYTGVLTEVGTGAIRAIEIVLQGNGVTITLGANLPGTYSYTYLAGNKINGPALVQMNGVQDVLVLTDKTPGY